MSVSDKNNPDFDSFLKDMREAEHRKSASDNVQQAEETENTDLSEGTVDASLPKKKHRALKALVAVAVCFALLLGGGYLGLRRLWGQFHYVPIEEQTGPLEAASGLTFDPLEPTGDPAFEISDEEYNSLIELLDANARENGVVMADENVWNILLIGADEVLSETVGRSDSMILVSVSHYTDSIVLTSFLRDCYIKIPERGYNRLNSALPNGGVALLAETIESNFGIHIDNYAMVDFDLFIDIVDALGGLYLTPTEEETEYINEIMTAFQREDLLIPEPNVLTRLNGFQSLYYARIRNIGNSDFDRTERQRKILLAAKDRVMSMDLPEIVELITQFMPRVTTDIDAKTGINLLFSAFNMLKNYSIQQHRIPMDDTYSDITVRGMEVLRIDDFDTNTEAWLELVYGESEAITVAEEEVSSDEDETIDVADE